MALRAHGGWRLGAGVWRRNTIEDAVEVVKRGMMDGEMGRGGADAGS